MGDTRLTKDGKVSKKIRKLYANQDVYEGDFVEMMRHGQGTLTYSGGDRYVGEFERDLFHGQGTFYWTPYFDDKGNFVIGKRYEGGWKNGKMHGSGIFLIGNGDTYAGMFEKGLFHGKGILKLKKGDIYDGDWIRGKPNGKMIIKYKNGDMYEGEMAIGKYHGRGKLSYRQNLGLYDGSWAFGFSHGEGTRVYSNGNKYVGMLYEGELHGEGIMFFANGDQYVGQWFRGTMSGKGVIRYCNGERYEGSFLHGVIHGEGKFTYTDGGYYSGEYKNVRVHPYTLAEFPQCDGLRHGFGMRVWSNGNKYQGQWKHGKMDGQGMYTTVKGEKFEGMYWNNLKHGFGREEFGNQLGFKYLCPQGHWHMGTNYCVYTGQYRFGMFDGEGTFTCQDGRHYKGEWRKGKRTGRGYQYYLRDGDIGDPQRFFIGGNDSLYRVREYDGEWVDDVKEGQGKLTYINGDSIEGLFVKGQPHGALMYRFANGKKRMAEYVRGERTQWLEEKYMHANKLMKWLGTRASDAALFRSVDEMDSGNSMSSTKIKSSSSISKISK